MSLKLHPEGVERVTRTISARRKIRSYEVVQRYFQNVDRARRQVIENEVFVVIELMMEQMQVVKKIALTKHDQDSLVQLFQTQVEAEIIVAKMLKILEPYTKEWDLGLVIRRKIEEHQRPWYMKNI